MLGIMDAERSGIIIVFISWISHCLSELTEFLEIHRWRAIDDPVFVIEVAEIIIDVQKKILDLLELEDQS